MWMFTMKPIDLIHHIPAFIAAFFNMMYPTGTLRPPAATRTVASSPSAPCLPVPVPRLQIATDIPSVGNVCATMVRGYSLPCTGCSTYAAQLTTTLLSKLPVVACLTMHTADCGRGGKGRGNCLMLCSTVTGGLSTLNCLLS